MSDKYRAVLKNIRITPRKARLVATLVRGKPVATALDLLKMTERRGAPIIAQLIKSAVANAMDRASVDPDRMVVAEIFVDKGMVLKRFLPRAQGRATGIQKRFSHITVNVKEI